MSILSRASETTLWNGVEYYEDEKVISFEDIGDERYKGEVSGVNGDTYNVYIDINQPEDSTCTCGFAKYKKAVCKHMIALLFAVHPTEYDKFLMEAGEYPDEEYLNDIKKYVYSLSIDDLRSELIFSMVEIDQLRNSNR